MRKLLMLISLLVFGFFTMAQKSARLQVLPAGIVKAEVFVNNTDRSFMSDDRGIVHLTGLLPHDNILTVFAEGYASQTLVLKAEDDFVLVELRPLNVELLTINVVDVSRSAQGMSRLKYIEVDGLYAAKKNDILIPDELSVNKSANNSRQLFSKVPGINVQETDAGGLQMGIGARGLDPKRTTNFNTRQDGYDISADALGYPESYYTPPIEAVERIELVRGAASLQYGTQFGGLLNFKMKRGNPNKKLEAVSRTTVGSYNYFGSFTSLGGSTGKWNYYGYYIHKEGDGWRPNSHFNANGAYVQLGRKLGENWELDLAYTHSYYNAKQPGGLTDRQFEEQAGSSFRDRNWFRVNWNVANITLNGKINASLSINSKTFALKSSRAALGFLGNITRIDTGGFRDLILGEFNNIGHETRLIQRFNFSDNPGAVLMGIRLYKGATRNRQGKAGSGDDADYDFNSGLALSGSDFSFPSRNAALFAEALIPLSSCFYLTPGMRWEHIATRADGYYIESSRHPLTGELLLLETIEAHSFTQRSIPLFGMGAAWKCNPKIEFYANASQNYRAMNFSDLYVSNPNLVIAKDMTDEHGYTIDIGGKGSIWDGAFNFDAGVFAMVYQNRIGEVLTAVENEEGVKRVVNYRTNIADARFTGIEAFGELNLLEALKSKSTWKLLWYNNIALTDARYLHAEVSAFHGKRVENVPFINFKTGISVRHKGFSAGLQHSYIGRQYTDATNAEFFPDATVGIIPAYNVTDLSLGYEWKRIKLEGSINNLRDQVYFTRRATGYPGPGIIPAERRMFFMTLEVKI